MLGFCERRGSGIDRAVAAIEDMHLPAARIAKEEMCTRVTLFPHKELNDMTKEEKIEACYQHACLVNEDGMSMNNQSVRERFNLKRRNHLSLQESLQIHKRQVSSRQLIQILYLRNS